MMSISVWKVVLLDMLWLLFVIISALMLAASAFCYRVTFHSPNIALDDPYGIPPGEQYEKQADKMLKFIGELERIPYQQVYITAWDGTKLAARYYHISDGGPVQLFFHGYRGNSVREFACGYHLAKELRYNALVIDQRGHGKSGGHTITFGIRERYDCRDWCNYAAKRFGENTRLFLTGVSMGGATVLMASDLRLPLNVAGIIADCPYASPGSIIRKICKDIKLPCWAVYPFVALGALLFGKFPIWESNAVRSVKNTTIPILLIHGADDRFVPNHMSRRIYDSCRSDKKMVFFPTAGHGLSYLTDPQRYTQIIRDFLHDCGISAK